MRKPSGLRIFYLRLCMQSLLHTITRHFRFPALMLLLLGCIQVDDFGTYWEKGFVDSCIKDILLTEMAEDIAAGKPTPAIRSLNINGHLFIMMRDKPEDKGGELVRYDVIGNE